MEAMMSCKSSRVEEISFELMGFVGFIDSIKRFYDSLLFGTIL